MTTIEKTYIELEEQASPPVTPASGLARLYVDSSGNLRWVDDAGAAKGATVSSVAMTVPSILSVAGSPITSTGTLAVSLASQSANTVFAGPTSGGAATPAFRALVQADLPAVLRARVYASGNLSIAYNTTTVLLFDLEHWDTSSFHSIVSNTGRLTAPVTGTYIITGHVRWAAGAGGIRELSLRLNGTTLIAPNVPSPVVDANGPYMQIATVYDLAANDYVELLAYQNQTSAAALNVIAAGNYSPEFAIALIG